MKNVSDHVVKSGKAFYVDAEDISTGDVVCSPKDVVQFTYKGRSYTAIVTDEAVGRDNDCYKLTIIG